jgi:Ca2+-binding EF-hand superfamily protein|tara:strand:+ start:1251 stop:1574 length:324 start_codon:yes stop_codon:yes gene_type:complete
LLANDDFRRCISKAEMKVEDRELNTLIEELDSEKKGQINYQEFLKYSYLSAMYLQHGRLRSELDRNDTQQKGLITVAQLDVILQGEEFNFPASALDEVFREMLGENL